MTNGKHDAAKDLRAVAAEVRKDIVRMHRRGTNVGSAMSCADILTALYFEILNIPSPDDPARDRFILSKGHAASALYSVLTHRGFADPACLDTYLHNGSPLTGHPSKGNLPGIEVSTGSLGHGLAIGIGMAMAARADGLRNRVFVLMGDGEIQEGTVWEAASLAATLKLDNLTAVVDANRLQGYARVDEIMPVSTFEEKWRAFGWATRGIDGHDLDAIRATLGTVPFAPGKPSAVIAQTIKGRGVSEMQDCLGWHYFSVPEEKLDEFISELDGTS